MTYFDCFLTASWMFAIGWFLGAIYVQNHEEQMEISQASKKSERYPKSEELRLPAVVSASAD